ncbi:MAG: TraR/DksA family transcriptional regulator [Bacteriovorax sp.]
MKTTALSKHHLQLLQRLAELETATANIKIKLSEASETRTSILQDDLDHAREQSDLCGLFEMNDRYISERRKILGALERIKKGSFGECDECGEMIAPKRLLAQPSALLCVDCQHFKEAYVGRM